MPTSKNRPRAAQLSSSLFVCLIVLFLQSWLGGWRLGSLLEKGAGLLDIYKISKHLDPFGMLSECFGHTLDAIVRPLIALGYPNISVRHSNQGFMVPGILKDIQLRATIPRQFQQALAGNSDVGVAVVVIRAEQSQLKNVDSNGRSIF